MSERSPYQDRRSSHPDNYRHGDRHYRHDDRYSQHSSHAANDNYRSDSHRQERARHPGAKFLDTYQTGASDRRHHSEIPDRVEEVWMKEKSGRISFNDSDLTDVTRPPTSNKKTTLAGFAGVAAMLALIGFLALSSTPDLSSHEIIAMSGYEGEQTTSTPFNLASFKNCNDFNECNQATEPARNITTQTAGSNSTASPEAPIAQTFPVAETFPASSSNTVFQEIPAATNTIVLDRYEGPVAEELPADPAPLELLSGEQLSSRELIVLKQWSNVRSAPNVNSNILTSLAKNTNVTMLGQSGEWFEISVVKGKEFTGYMHRSTVAAQ